MNIWLVLAIVCAAILAMMGFDIITATHATGFLGLALLFYFLSLVIPYTIGPRRAA